MNPTNPLWWIRLGAWENILYAGTPQWQIDQRSTKPIGTDHLRLRAQPTATPDDFRATAIHWRQPRERGGEGNWVE
jgi:hypothetical protein